MDSLLIHDVPQYISNLATVSQSLLHDEVECQCPICLVPYSQPFAKGEPAEEPLRLPCGHIVGGRCIGEWLTTTTISSGGGASCPICRRQLGENMRHWHVQEVGTFRAKQLRIADF